MLLYVGASQQFPSTVEDGSLTWAEFYYSSYILQSAVSLVLLAVRVFLLLLVVSAEEKPRCTHEEKMLQCKYVYVYTGFRGKYFHG